MRGKRCRNRDSFRKTAGTRLYFKIRCFFHFAGWLLEWNLIGVKLGNQNKFLFLLRVIKSTESCKPHHNSKLTSVEISKATRTYTHYKLKGRTFSRKFKILRPPVSGDTRPGRLLSSCLTLVTSLLDPFGQSQTQRPAISLIAPETDPRLRGMIASLSPGYSSYSNICLDTGIVNGRVQLPGVECLQTRNIRPEECDS